MALALADRVQETSTTTGTGAYDLDGAVTGFQGFVAGVGGGNTCYYCAEDGTNWEVGRGTVTDASPDTLARTEILASSNSGSAVNWSAGTRNIFVTQPASKGLIPTGSVIPFAGASAPSGYLFCYGQNVNRTTYADLFAEISTTYGTGDGSTTFGLPDLRGRVVAGQDDMGGSSANRLTGATGGVDGDVLGGTGGSETHQLTTAQLASHKHGFQYEDNGSKGGNYIQRDGVANDGTDNTLIQNAGSDNAHNNVQPTIILNYIIKT